MREWSGNERKCAFGQHKVEGTIIGAVLCTIAVVAIAKGWLMPWGLVVWIPVLILGLLFLCLVGHFLFVFLILAPFIGLRSLFSRSLRPPRDFPNAEALLESFREAFGPERFAELETMLRPDLDFVDQDGSALLRLADEIYEHNIPVTPQQEVAFLELGQRSGFVDRQDLPFLGQTPPYKPLGMTIPSELTPSFEVVRILANEGKKIAAIKMYRGLSGADLRSAKEYVEGLSD